MPNNTSKDFATGLNVSKISLTRPIEAWVDGVSFANLESYSGFSGMYLSKTTNNLIVTTKANATGFNLIFTLHYTKN